MKVFFVLVSVLVLLTSAGCQAEEYGQTAMCAKASIDGDIHPMLINGTPVKPGEWKNVISIRTGNAGCTATLIGPKVFVTAAHCGTTGATSTFGLDSVTYNAVLTRSSLYPAQDHDLNLGLLDKEVPAVSAKPATVGGKAVTGNSIHLLGYGCTTEGGGGGNDGILREGDTIITGFYGFDMVSKKDGGAALCYGDSGGPSFDMTDATKPRLLGVNSKGNIKDTNYNARLDLPESQDFLKKFAADNKVDICGINKDCDGGPQPPVKEFDLVGKAGKMHFVVDTAYDTDYVKTIINNAMLYLDSQPKGSLKKDH